MSAVGRLAAHVRRWVLSISDLGRAPAATDLRISPPFSTEATAPQKAWRRRGLSFSDLGRALVSRDFRTHSPTLNPKARRRWGLSISDLGRGRRPDPDAYPPEADSHGGADTRARWSGGGLVIRAVDLALPPRLAFFSRRFFIGTEPTAVARTTTTSLPLAVRGTPTVVRLTSATSLDLGAGEAGDA